MLLRPQGNRKTHTLLVETWMVHSLRKQTGRFLNIKHTTSHFTITWNFAQEKRKCMCIQRCGHQCSQHLWSTVMLTEPHSTCNSLDYSSPGVEGRTTACLNNGTPCTPGTRAATRMNLRLRCRKSSHHLSLSKQNILSAYLHNSL